MEAIRNYYEEQVISQLELHANSHPEISENELSDMACIALNHLPSKYYRHAIDLSFYADRDEKRAIINKVEKALDQAISQVKSNPRT